MNWWNGTPPLTRGQFCINIFTLIVSQEVFYLTYTPDDVEGNQQLETGDKVSFYMETNKQ